MGALTGRGNKAQRPIIYDSLQIGSSMQNLPIALFWGQRRISTNAIWYNNFDRHKVNTKGKGGKGPTLYDYTAAVALGLCEGPIDGVVNVWAAGSTTTTTTLSKLNMALFLGTASQAPWSYVTTNYPTQARSYAYTAYLGCPKLDLGASATIPDNAFECVRTSGLTYTHTSNGWINPTTHAVTSAIDGLLSDVIVDLLTNPQYGMQFSGSDLGDVTSYATYQRAQGLFFSPLLKSQEKCTDVFNRWAKLSNSWIYWAGTQLQFVPLGDAAVTGNGVTYTPDLTPAYDLSLDNGDFLDGKNPVKVTRKDPADCYNRTSLQICHRPLGYVSVPVEYKDQTLVDLFGLRDNSSQQADEICDPAVGTIVAQLIGKRNAYLRNEYSFKTHRGYILCLPGTVITLTEPNEGLSKERVRVKSIEENDDATLNFTCEELPGTIGTYYAPQASAAINTPTVPNQYMDPGNVNTPAVIEPDSSFTGGVAKVIIAASGGANWGGCVVNISFDGVNYDNVGEITSGAPQGVLTSSLAAAADPDLVDTLAVDCTESLTIPQQVTNADADALRTLSLVAPQPMLSGGAMVLPNNGELLAFGAVAATATYAANLTYLRRGKYGSSIGAHSAGDQFTVIDVLGTSGSTFSYDLPKQYIGQPIYLKLASFNLFGNEQQDISVCTEYSYTPSGAGYGTANGGLPAQPTGFAVVTKTDTQISFSWSANATTDNIQTYEIWGAPGSSVPFASTLKLASVSALVATVNGLTANTAYTFYLLARNAVGPSSPSSVLNATTNTANNQVAVTASSTPTTLSATTTATTYYDINNTTGAPLEVRMPPSPIAGQIIVVVDAGRNAGANAFTIKTNDGLTVLDTITVNNGWSKLRWTGSVWRLGG